MATTVHRTVCKHLTCNASLISSCTSAAASVMSANRHRAFHFTCSFFCFQELRPDPKCARAHRTWDRGAGVTSIAQTSLATQTGIPMCKDSAKTAPVPEHACKLLFRFPLSLRMPVHSKHECSPLVSLMRHCAEGAQSLYMSPCPDKGGISSWHNVALLALRSLGRFVLP